MPHEHKEGAFRKPLITVASGRITYEPQAYRGVDVHLQSKEMTLALESEKWLIEINSHIRKEVLRDLDKAWQRYQKGLARKPRFKRYTDPMSFYQPKGTGRALWYFEGSRLHLMNGPALKSLGPIKAKADRPFNTEDDGAIYGTQTGLRIVREAHDEWYASVTYKKVVPDPEPLDLPWVGIDRGVIYPVVDSEGKLTENPDFYGRLEKKLHRLQKVISRKYEKWKALRQKNPTLPRKSQNIIKLEARVAKAHAEVARFRDWWLHQLANYYIQKYGVIVVEKLQVKNMTRSAKGTLEKPGKNVKSKSGLNRSILSVGWGKFVMILKYKAEENGNTIIEVDPKNSSRTCHSCGHTSKKNRVSRDLFCCTQCGLEDHADVNASKVILKRGLEQHLKGTQTKPEKKTLRKVYRRKKELTPTAAT